MAQPPKANAKRGNEPEPRPIIIKKVIADGHAGHHGGAWKVAYADFVTAMMAFFLLMWLLGATTEKQRKGLADYFTPTLVQMKMDSAGASGIFGGDSFVAKENYPTTGGQGNVAITIPRDATGVRDVGGEDIKDRDRKKFEQLKKTLDDRFKRDRALRKLRKNIKMTETKEGLRIDLIDEADFAMFKMGTAELLPEARALLAQVSKAIAGVPNDVIVRGHTDSLPYSAGRSMNNWMLSSSRAESTRAVLAQNGVTGSRFARIEGLADREPFVPGDLYDPRNRRMSVILAWSKGLDASIGQGEKSAGDFDQDPREDGHYAVDKTQVARRIAVRESFAAQARREANRLDLGKTALPRGAAISNQPYVAKPQVFVAPGRNVDGSDAMKNTPPPSSGGH